MKRIRLKSKPEEAFTVIVDDEYAFTVNELEEISYSYELMLRSDIDTYLYKNDDIEARLETEKSEVSLLYEYFFFGYDDDEIIALVDYLEERFEKVIIDQNDWKTDIKLDDYEITLIKNKDYVYQDMLIKEIKHVADELKRKTK
ncbi:MAG: hypothetical protein WHU54_09565 [Candidatus Bathyarchaeia archaeon]